MSGMQTITVLIADDHAILRAGLKMLINAQPIWKSYRKLPMAIEPFGRRATRVRTWR